MMTKDDDVTSSSAQSLVAMSSGGAAVLVSLPTSLTTADLGGHGVIFQGTTVKDEGDDDLTAGLNAAGITMATPISNVRATHATLQSLLAAPISAARVIPQQEHHAIQVITLPASSDLITTSQPDGAGRVWQVVPSLGNPEIATIIAVADPSELINGTKTDLGDCIDLDMQDGSGELSVTNADTMAAILMPPPPPVDCPSWAARLQCCEKIGESYRGYVESEVELDLLLTYHKQQTRSFWGTRQSPSPAKPSTRLMWKSQYVPFDGIPFVNIGSRAVVMECQFGPRRKGNTHKRYSDGAQVNQYRQTCPARIYIKRVRKFPEYAVDLRQDKKSLRMAMDKAFHDLREQRLEGWGSERFYIQLPTEKAHEFHEDSPNSTTEMRRLALDVEQYGTTNIPVVDTKEPEGGGVRLHPKVSEKIRGLVANGEMRVYAIRKQLRAFVLRELFAGSDRVPERHDLTLFPTVNDLKNHIHQAIKDIESGALGVTASTINVEILPADGSDCDDRIASLVDKGFLSSAIALPETVTVTLTSSPGADGHHMISRIETHMSDGTTQISNTLTPETAQLLSRLHPAIFPAESLMQLGVSQPSEDLAATAGDLDIVSVSEALTDGSNNMVVMAGEDSSGAADETGEEEMHIISSAEACSQLFQQSVGEDQNGQMTLAGSEDGVLTEDDSDKNGDSVLVNDTDMITIAMTDDNQLVLTGAVSEAFDSQ